MRRPAAVLMFLLVAACKPPAAAPIAEWNSAPSFWLWSPQSAADLNAFETFSGDRLYWQILELERPEERWQVKRTADPAVIADRPAVIPVVRLARGRETLIRPDTLDALVAALRPYGPVRLQIDYDCPAALLENYAAFLSELRARAGLEFLSATALASWIDAPGLDRLVAATDELVPMFYDLEADLPAEILAGNPRPLIDDSTLRWIGKWSACPGPWRAGLPNYERLTLFNDDGTLVGHLGGWPAAALQDHPALQLRSSADLHTTTFAVTARSTLSKVRLLPGQWLVWRAPDERLLSKAIATARDSGASGAVWFALPGSGPPARHSVSHLAALSSGGDPRPSPALTAGPDGSLILANRGPGDLPTRTENGGWRLELSASDPGTFGSSTPGGFARIDAPGSSPARLQIARKIVLSFPHLRVGEVITSGPGLFADPSAPLPEWSIAPPP